MTHKVSQGRSDVLYNLKDNIISCNYFWCLALCTYNQEVSRYIFTSLILLIEVNTALLPPTTLRLFNRYSVVTSVEMGPIFP